MLVQIGFLCERKIASLVVTYVRPLFSMDSEVVIEVVPFPEYFGTFRMGTT